MMYSYKIEQAIRAAAVLHRNQVRRGSIPYPYVTHLFAVACIIADYTSDEEIIIAGLLHDTLEDTDYTAKEMQNDFGVRVRKIVEGVSEPQMPPGEEDWKKKKQAYFDTLKNAPDESFIVAAADKIHNMRSAIEEYNMKPKKFLADFGGSLNERVASYQKISNLFNRKLDSEILHEWNHVFTEYKKFIDYAQK